RAAVAAAGSHPATATLSDLAGRLPGAARGRVLSLGERLRALLSTLHREHEVLRTAAAALASHMDGLMRQIGRRLSHAGTYERPRQARGEAAGPWPGAVAPVVTALDMTS